MRDNTTIGFHEAQALSEWQRERARTEGYPGEPTPLDPSAVAARGRELLAEGERLLQGMSLPGRE